MTFKSFVLASFFVLASPIVGFSFNVSIRSSSDSVDYTSASDVASFLGFQIFKLSLLKNNIPFDFATNGMYKPVSGQEVASCASINNIYLSTSGGGVCNVILWPRDAIVNHTSVCDYAVMCVFSGVRPSGSTYPISWYIYFDYGVVSITNYLGADYTASFQDKSVSLVSNVSNSMPILVSDKGMTYFSNKVRIYNLLQTQSSSSISSFKYGSVYEFSSTLGEALMKYSGSTYSTWAGDNTYSLQTLSVLRQSDLPWQMQSFNASFNVPGQTQPGGIAVVDTDQGTEPDLSEYYNGHDYLIPSDDWGQPAEIGGGSGVGAGGEVTEFGPQAEQQLRDGIEQGASDALEDYFGTSSDLSPTLDSTSYSEALTDPDPDDYWLDDPSQATADLLPSGASTFRSLVDRLKAPDSGSLPSWTLDLSVDTGSIAGVVFQGATVDIDLADLTSSSNNWIRTLRTIAVICMYISVIIYILKDNLLLGGNAQANGD